MSEPSEKPTTEAASSEAPPSEGQWTRGICGVCPAGCWIEARIEEDQLVGIRADTTHPLGMICRRGEHAPEIVHSDRRLATPMRRLGPKGTFDFEPITWDEAYDAIVENLEKIREESGPEAVSIYTGRGSFELSLCDMFQPKDVAVSSASNVLFPFGSPNTMGVGALCYVSFAMIAPHVTMGSACSSTCSPTWRTPRLHRRLGLPIPPPTRRRSICTVWRRRPGAAPTSS